MDYLEIAKKKATMEDLDEKYQGIAGIIGMDNFIRLCEYMGGGSIYFPTLKEALKPYVYRMVLNSAGIMSKEQLARAYGLSKSTVYKLFHDAGE